MTNALIAKQSNDLVQTIIERVLDGSSLKDATKECGIDVFKFNRMLQGDKAAALAYARAVEIRADILADEALHIADTENDAAKARNQIGVRQWLASKLYAKRYGDRIDLNVTQTIDVSATLAEARARLVLPVRDQQTIIDVQPRMNPSVAEHRPSDNESSAPVKNEAPDIFS